MSDLSKPRSPTDYYRMVSNRILTGPDPAARLHLGKFAILAIDLTMRTHPNGPDGNPCPVLDCTLHVVVDAETGVIRPNTITLTETVPREAVWPGQVRAIARGLILEALAHEVDEWLTIDGKRQPPEHDE